jgi:hypothetical protein
MTADLNLDCLSLMELLEVRDGTAEQHQAAHVDGCRRCRALLESLPTVGELPQPLPPTGAQWTEAIARRPASGRVGTGALWRAVPDAAAERAWLVAIIGRSPEAEDRLLVAPVFGDPELATDTDLLLDDAVLGYGAFVDVGNVGMLLRQQLRDPVGDLDRAAAEALVGLYRHVVTGAEAPSDVRRGLPSVDEADPRLLAQAERAETLRALWAATDRLVDDAPGHEAPQREPVAAIAGVGGVGSLILACMSGVGAQWDRSSLLEASGAEGVYLDRFLDDRLDLTDRKDVPHLARVLHTLDLGWGEAAPAVHATLLISEGGAREATGSMLRMAARSRRGASRQEVERQLYAHQSRIETSEAKRKGQISAYLAELRTELDDLG